MTDWLFIQMEYRFARREHGWQKALRIALKKNREATHSIPF